MANILLVEDDLDLIHLFAEHLRSCGHTVDCVEDGAEALKSVQYQLPDMVITDIIMPTEDGIGLILGMRRIYGQNLCPILVISGGGRVGAGDYLKAATSLGAAASLEKPFRLTELEEKVEALLAS